FGKRFRILPLTKTFSSEVNFHSNLERISDNFCALSHHSSDATAAAFPSPTIPGTLSVPDRKPRSCPPPCNCEIKLTRGFFLRTYKAPTPFGPYILCAEIQQRS